MDSIIVVDFKLFEVGRCFEHLSQLALYKECSELIGATTKEGKEGRRARITGKMKILHYILLNIQTHTHKCFQVIVFSGSLSLS